MTLHTLSYVQKFVDADGVGLLTELLNQANERGHDCFSVPILCCFKALLNCSVRALSLRNLSMGHKSW